MDETNIRSIDLSDGFHKSNANTTVIIGPRNSGKTVFLRYLYSIVANKYKPENIFVFDNDISPKLPNCEDYKNFQYNDKNLNKMIKYIKDNRSDDNRFLIIIDNNYLINYKNSIVRDLFLNGRFYGVDIFLSIQYPMELPPAIRSNIDNVIILQNNNNNWLNKIYQYYANNFTNFDMFEKVLSNLDHYEALFIEDLPHKNNHYICKSKIIDNIDMIKLKNFYEDKKTVILNSDLDQQIKNINSTIKELINLRDNLKALQS